MRKLLAVTLAAGFLAAVVPSSASADDCVKARVDGTVKVRVCT